MSRAGVVLGGERKTGPCSAASGDPARDKASTIQGRGTRTNIEACHLSPAHPKGYSFANRQAKAQP